MWGWLHEYSVVTRLEGLTIFGAGLVIGSLVTGLLLL